MRLDLRKPTPFLIFAVTLTPCIPLSLEVKGEGEFYYKEGLRPS